MLNTFPSPFCKGISMQLRFQAYSSNVKNTLVGNLLDFIRKISDQFQSSETEQVKASTSNPSCPLYWRLKEEGKCHTGQTLGNGEMLVPRAPSVLNLQSLPKVFQPWELPSRQRSSQGPCCNPSKPLILGIFVSL